ncbi:MAG TPA: cell division protein ZapA [Acidobacteriaceae bacterium]|nr:cell division protein ZapA [Acidobacteriaceae bacterium]
MARNAASEEATTRQSATNAQGGATAVSVDIYDQVYHLRGTDPKHIEKLASLVDTKMRAVAAHGSTVDSLRVAVLASLNIADELLALRARYDALAGNAGTAETAMRSRAGTLSDMLDEVLEQCG